MTESDIKWQEAKYKILWLEAIKILFLLLIVINTYILLKYLMILVPEELYALDTTILVPE